MTTTTTTTSKQANVAQWIASAIADTGCRHVFGGHGGAVVPLVNAIVEHPSLEWIYARNEHDAATMAAAYAKYTGRLGVVVATSGPGATNLVTGLMEAVLDELPLLALTGLKSTSLLGHAEFQDVNQSQLFLGAGITWTKDVSSSTSGVVPLLRDAISTAIRDRTCTHLAIPEDIQALSSPLPIVKCCTYHSNIGFPSPTVMDVHLIKATARTLVGNTKPNPGSRQERNVIAVGLRALPSSANGNAKNKANKNQEEEGEELSNKLSQAILKLAQVLRAPVLTRLHAKGLVDEYHPLHFGIVGVHGKPGMEAAATLIGSSTRVVSVGVQDEMLLLCNKAGIQVRNFVDIQPDYSALKTRYASQHVIVGNVIEICRQLSEEVQSILSDCEGGGDIGGGAAGTPSNIHQLMVNGHPDQGKSHDHQLDYMLYNNPLLVEELHAQLEMEPTTTTNSTTTTSSNINKKKNAFAAASFAKSSNEVWQKLHRIDWNELSERKEWTCHIQPVKHPHHNCEKYCYPTTVLEYLSKQRRDEEKIDKIYRKATICVDVGDITLWASLSLKLTAGSRTLYSERLGTMGYALNAAIASIAANHPQPSAAVVLVGDGAFQMTLQELATFQQIRRQGDKLICIVFDNQKLGRVAFGFNNAKGAENLLGPDYVMLAKSYGGDGILVNSDGMVEEAMTMAAQADGLLLIHVLVDPQVKADMANFKLNHKALLA